MSESEILGLLKWLFLPACFLGGYLLGIFVGRYL